MGQCVPSLAGKSKLAGGGLASDMARDSKDKQHMSTSTKASDMHEGSRIDPSMSGVAASPKSAAASESEARKIDYASDLSRRAQKKAKLRSTYTLEHTDDIEDIAAMGLQAAVAAGKLRKPVMPNVSGDVSGQVTSAPSASQTYVMTADEKAFLCKCFSKHFLLSGLDAGEREVLTSLLVKKQCSAGMAVVNQGEKGDCCYFIQSGIYSIAIDGSIIRQLKRGASFGELAMLYNAMRSATVSCFQAGVVWSLDSFSFRLCMQLLNSRNLSRTTDALKVIDPEFDKMEENVRTEIVASVFISEYSDGDLILRSADSASAVHVLLSGCVLASGSNVAGTSPKAAGVLAAAGQSAPGAAGSGAQAAAGAAASGAGLASSNVATVYKDKGLILGGSVCLLSANGKLPENLVASGKVTLLAIPKKLLADLGNKREKVSFTVALERTAKKQDCLRYLPFFKDLSPYSMDAVLKCVELADMEPRTRLTMYESSGGIVGSSSKNMERFVDVALVLSGSLRKAQTGSESVGSGSQNTRGSHQLGMGDPYSSGLGSGQGLGPGQGLGASPGLGFSQDPSTSGVVYGPRTGISDNKFLNLWHSTGKPIGGEKKNSLVGKDKSGQGDGSRLDPSSLDLDEELQDVASDSINVSSGSSGSRGHHVLGYMSDPSINTIVLVLRRMTALLSKEVSDRQAFKILSEVFLFKSLYKEQLEKLVTKLVPMEFLPGQTIVRTGDPSDMFYLIQRGSVEVLVKNETVLVRTLGVGDYFGERGLLFNDKRSATCRAAVGQQGPVSLTEVKEKDKEKDRDVPTGYSSRNFTSSPSGSGRPVSAGLGKNERPNTRDGNTTAKDGNSAKDGSLAKDGSPRPSAAVGTGSSASGLTVRCLALRSDDFIEVVGSFRQELETRIILQDNAITVSDLETIAIVGQGTFGKVSLVRHKQDSRKEYALKQVSKAHVKKMHQTRSLIKERDTMLECYHPCIVQFIKSFKDGKNIYFLTEFLGGGDLFFAIREIGSLTKAQCQYYIASISFAIDYLHDRGIMYRDLKPENVLLDFRGNLKLVDFGCCKKATRTFTLVGTPEYMAPEVITGKGYDSTCDWWSLGVMAHEFIVGPLPFNGGDKDDQLELFRQILEQPLSLPPNVLSDKSAVSLLNGLLHRISPLRLGASRGMYEIREHEYFSNFSFDGVLTRKVKPPWLPNMASMQSRWKYVGAGVGVAIGSTSSPGSEPSSGSKSPVNGKLAKQESEHGLSSEEEASAGENWDADF